MASEDKPVAPMLRRYVDFPEPGNPIRTTTLGRDSLDPYCSWSLLLSTGSAGGSVYVISGAAGAGGGDVFFTAFLAAFLAAFLGAAFFGAAFLAAGLAVFLAAFFTAFFATFFAAAFLAAFFFMAILSS